MVSSLIQDWVQNPWFQVSGFLVGLLGVAIAVVIWLVTRRYKRLRYDVRSFTLVERERSTVPSLQVLFEKKPVEALTISKVCIWNSGTDPLRRGDFAPLQPLRVGVATTRIEILEASLIQTSSRDSSCKIVRTGRGSFEVEFDFIDPRHGVVVQIAHTGTSSESVKVSGHLIGGGKIVRVQPLAFLTALKAERLRPKTLRARRTFALWLVFLGGILMIAMPWLPPRKISPSVASQILPVAMGLCYLFVGCSLYRSRPPKGLERYEDEFQGADFRRESFRFAEAPQFGSRKEAADWVVGQAQALARASHAKFNARIVSENEIDLDLGSYYWLTVWQISDIIELGRKHGFKVAVHGTSNNPFIPPEMYEKE